MKQAKKARKEKKRAAAREIPGEKYRPLLSEEEVMDALSSGEEEIRARTARSLCPCRSGWELFEKYAAHLAALQKDPSPLVRGEALHVFEDASQMESEAYPTHPRLATNEMMRLRRASRFRSDRDELAERNAAAS